jgi:mannitol-1-phosphate 5-dehydrogenase
MAAVSVGKANIPGVLPGIAEGLKARYQQESERPLDIIIAENDREAGTLCSTTLGTMLGPEYPLEKLLGIVETSIGKMVPLMHSEDLEGDPLTLFAEEYETLIVDKQGFRGPIPAVTNLSPVEDIKAYVDRKLFVHNLGHAAAAYLGFQAAPEEPSLARVLNIAQVEAGVRSAMNEAADALARAYPKAFTRQDLAAHIEDLLARFKNRALGDTVHRVGRDLPRKLNRDDRLVGAMLLCAAQGLPFPAIVKAYLAGLNFAAPDENGAIFGEDARFRSNMLVRGTETVLYQVSGLDKQNPIDQQVIGAVLAG